MSDISSVTTSDGVTYTIKDSTARQSLVPSGGTTGQVLTKTASGYGWENASGGGGGTWGSITGTLSDQTDLQTALNGKLDNPALASYINYTNNWSATKNLADILKSYLVGYTVTISASGWNSEQTLKDGEYWYTYDIVMPSGKTLFASNPIIGPYPTGSNWFPTDDELKAYNTWEYAHTNMSANEINLFSREVPTTDFGIVIFGVV